MAERKTCGTCGQDVLVNKDGSLRAHAVEGEWCAGGRQPEPKTLEQKADRYLTENRVLVVEATQGSALVLVTGSKGIQHPYHVRFLNGAWTCDCEARVWRCAHVIAAQKVTKSAGPASLRIGGDSEWDDLFFGPREKAPEKDIWALMEGP